MYATRNSRDSQNAFVLFREQRAREESDSSIMPFNPNFPYSGPKVWRTASTTCTPKDIANFEAQWRNQMPFDPLWPYGCELCTPFVGIKLNDEVKALHSLHKNPERMMFEVHGMLTNLMSLLREPEMKVILP